MAGVSRLQYSSEIRLIRVMCSGRVDLEFILRSFLNGMDGVFLGACHLGECNYITHGNYSALNTVLLAKKILAQIGIDPSRLTIEFMSSGEGNRFAELVDRFTKNLRELGPLGLPEEMSPEEMLEKLTQVMKLVPYIKIALRDKLASRFANEAEYQNLFSDEEVHQLLYEPTSYYIDPVKCRACGTCLRRCPVGAIEGAKKTIHVIDQDICIKCGTCLEVCPAKFSAVTKLANQPVPPAIPAGQRLMAEAG
ncbi:MAG: hydrogenase iron-sulfur subunit [Deltaproteobacteria bacterium]|nr:hydrogenase iron-sulfur subunit [Deltaproteobacteria bacterium]